MIIHPDSAPGIRSCHKKVLPMLVLSRKESKRIRLGDSIVLTIVRVSGDKVRLGIEAPADIVVLRDELKPKSPAEAPPAPAAKAA